MTIQRKPVSTWGSIVLSLPRPRRAAWIILLVTLPVLLVPDCRNTWAAECIPASLHEGQYSYRDTMFVMFPRRYMDLEPAKVAWVCQGHIRAAVRFRDTFKALTDKTGSFRRIGFQIYIAGEVLETVSGLLVALPHLHYTPWLDEPLRRGRELKKGEKFIVEGISAGICRDMPIVYADRILTPEEGTSTVEYELTLRGDEWETPITIDSPGGHEVSIPTSATTTVRMTVTTEHVPRAEILAWWKNLLFDAATAEEGLNYESLASGGWPSVQKGMDIRYRGRVQSIGIPPERLIQVKTPSGVTLSIGGYALVDGKVPCLIPEGEAVLIERASRILPGQNVVVEGTVLDHPDEGLVLIVHDFWFSEISARPESLAEWRVTLTGKSLRPRCLYMPGDYRLLWKQGEAQPESEITVTLREFRIPGH